MEWSLVSFSANPDPRIFRVLMRILVFLRVLEYYPGILFLTTNRIGSFDPGFRSRIHLSLYYPSLDKDKTTKIWGNNLQRVKQNNEKRKSQKLRSIELNEDEILNFARDNFEQLNWNGRQIRNAFQTAIALAEFKAEELAKTKNSKSRKTVTVTAHDFYTVAKAASEFDEYLVATLQGQEGDLAHKEKLRASGFKAVKTKKLVKPKKNDGESESGSDGEHTSEASGGSLAEDSE
jgi:hypothetical protein